MSLLAEVPAAPLAPEVALTGALILLAFAWIVLYGMKYGYDYSFGALLRKLADVLDVGVWKIHVGGGFAFRAVDDFLQARLADGIDEVELAMAKTFHGLELVVRMTGDALVAFGADVHQALDGLVHGTIPSAVGAATKPIARNVGNVRTILARELARVAHQLAAKAHALEVELDRDFGRAWRGIDAIRSRSLPDLYHELLGDIAAVRGYTLRHLRALRARLRTLELALGAGAIAAIAIGALTRVFPYWKCTNVRRAMRGICRMDATWLNLLFGVGVEAFVIADLCDFIGALSSASRRAQPALVAFASAEGVLINCPHASYPAPLPAYPIALPPAQRRAPLPAEAV